ncbi:uncharacterized protein At3g49720-like [Olea europaea var. sylvestris]|uniref:uncharacterized protein At3g49720-like n=1 Tax=Olea europaea var. sylvestris TaxID=158386 RepID=UPI000C1D5052|nr:uncharacterized protein At3g49720-like [Olea europaea var. sylvestris]
MIGSRNGDIAALSRLDGIFSSYKSINLYINWLPARVSADGLVILSGFPGHQRAKVAELSKFGRPAKLRSSSWWIRFFIQTSLEENEAATKKFEQAAAKKSYKSTCQVFHLKPLH